MIPAPFFHYFLTIFYLDSMKILNPDLYSFIISNKSQNEFRVLKTGIYNYFNGFIPSIFIVTILCFRFYK